MIDARPQRSEPGFSFAGRAVLFDMDGVLVSSIGSVERSWRRWAKEFGVPGADSYQVPHGMRAVDIVRQLTPTLEPLLGLQRIEDLELADMEDLKVLPGAGELMRALPEDRWTVVSSATRRILVGRLEQAGLPIPSRFISGDMVEQGKPHPEPYRRGAALLHVRPEECLVVEDAPSGVRAGAAAGCTVLGVEGTHPAEDLLAAGARWVVPSLVGVQVEQRGLELLLAV